MKALINIPKWVWFCLFIVITISIAFLVFLLNYKIETTLTTEVKTEGTTKSLYVNSDVAYRINENDTINIKIGEKTYQTLINKIYYDDELKLYKLELSSLKINLLPESTLKAIIITGSKTIGSFLFGSV